MKMLKSMNFGVRGWLLLAYQFLGYVCFSSFTNYPMNMLGDLYGGSQKLSMIYTTAAIVAIVIQLILSAFIGKIKSFKKVTVFLGVIAMIFALCMMLIPPSHVGAWQACYFILCVFATMWATFSIGVLVGQWFPTKKGAFMGIATLAFPIINGMMGLFAGLLYGKGYPDVFGAYLPYWIAALIGLIIGIVAIKDYPEQCGCHRDNNKDMTPEIANAMLAQEIEAKKTSVWKTAGCFTSRDYWFITISIGGLLLGSVGMMAQTAPILGSFGAEMDKFGGFAGVMIMVMILGILGSFVIGLIDTAIGTKKAIILSCVIMVISGALGMVGTAGATVASIAVLSVYMGASSNFLVSVSAQYWRREDFSSVFGCVNPVANVIQAAGPALIAMILAIKGTTGVFGMLTIFGVICVILSVLFSPKNVKNVDDKRRAKAGKELDDALVGRK